MKARIGVIGIGGFCTHYHLPHLVARRDVDIVALCDSSAERLHALRGELAFIPQYTDYRRLLDIELDALLISTPNIYHFEQCRDALMQGVHVLVDKPMVMTTVEAEALVRLSRSAGRILMTAYTRHFMASARRVRQNIESGLSVAAISAVQRKNLDHRATQHGGMLHTREVHIIDLIPWITGRSIVGVSGRIEYGPEGYEKVVDMRLRLQGGPDGHLLCLSGDGFFEDHVTVYGMEQSYRIEKERLYNLDQREGWSEVKDLPHCGNCTDHFVNAVQRKVNSSGSFAALDGRDGLRAHRVIDAIKEAGRTGRFVDLQPALHPGQC